MHGLMRGAMAAALVSVSVTAGTAPTLASDYPNKPVRIIVPFPAGASTDNIARPLAERLSAALGEQFVVENRGGAGGVLGTEALARATPDGYTIMITPQTPLAVMPNLRKMPYDPSKDVVPVARMSEVVAGLAVHPSVGAKTLDEFIALAKKNPGKYTFASAGVGTITHLRGEMLKQMAGIDLLHVPYRGNGEAMPDLLAGNVHAMFEAVVFPHVKSGKLNLLAIIDDQRFPEFPNTPTIKELGFKDYNMPIWFGTYAPAGTPQAVIDRLHTEIAKIHTDKEFRAKLMEVGMRVYDKAETPAEIAARLVEQTKTFGDIIRTANVRIDG